MTDDLELHVSKTDFATRKNNNIPLVIHNGRLKVIYLFLFYCFRLEP